MSSMVPGFPQSNWATKVISVKVLKLYNVSILWGFDFLEARVMLIHLHMDFIVNLII